MRASSLLLFSAGMSLASTLGYFFYTRHAEPAQDTLASGQQDELDDIAEEIDRQVDHFDPAKVQSDTARHLAELLELENDTLQEIDKDLNRSGQKKDKPSKKKAEKEPDQQKEEPSPNEPDTAAPEAAPDDTEKPAPALTPTDLEAAREKAEPLTQRTAVHGKTFPYRLIVPEDWKILFNEPERCVLAYKDIFVFVETGPWTTRQEEWARKSFSDMQAAYPDLALVGQKRLEIDGRPWQQLFLREPGAVLVNPREMMLLTYGARKRGSYRIVITGQAHVLDEHVESLNQLISTWHFPADNFQPENTSDVRVYIDGIRQYY